MRPSCAATLTPRAGRPTARPLPPRDQGHMEPRSQIYNAVAEVAAGLRDADRVERRAEGALGKKRDRLLLRHE